MGGLDVDRDPAATKQWPGGPRVPEKLERRKLKNCGSQNRFSRTFAFRTSRLAENFIEMADGNKSALMLPQEAIVEFLRQCYSMSPTTIVDAALF